MVKYLPDRLTNNLVSLIDVTSSKVKNLGIKKVGLLASPATIESKLYSSRLRNIEVVTLSKEDQTKTEHIIRSVIAGKIPDTEQLTKQVDKLKHKGAEKVILGCTELSILNDKSILKDVIDPVEEVIKVLLPREDAL